MNSLELNISNMTDEQIQEYMNHRQSNRDAITARNRVHTVHTVHCDNWDPSVDDGPQEIVCRRTGVILGVLMPVDWEAVLSSPGIQPWSKGSPRTTAYEDMLKEALND